MKQKRLLHIFTTGILEGLLYLGFSFPIWINVLEYGETYALYVFYLLLMMQIGISLWLFFFRQRAMAYLGFAEQNPHFKNIV